VWLVFFDLTRALSLQITPVDLSIDRITRSRRNRFTSVRLDRLVEYRDNEEWVEAAQNSEAARFVPLWRSRSLLASTDEGQIAVYLKPGELDRPDAIQPPTLLGTDGKRYFFAVSINDSQREKVLALYPEAQFAIPTGCILPGTSWFAATRNAHGNPFPALTLPSSCW